MSELHPNNRSERNQDEQARRFMEWVQGLGCLICHLEEWRRFFVGELELPPKDTRGSEAAHIGGSFSAKAYNTNCAPLCTVHHRAGKLSQEELKMDFFAYFGLEWPMIRGLLWIAFLAWDGYYSREFDYSPGTCKVGTVR